MPLLLAMNTYRLQQPALLCLETSNVSPSSLRPSEGAQTPCLISAQCAAAEDGPADSPGRAMRTTQHKRL